VGIDERTGKKRFKSKSGFNTKKECEKACAAAVLEIENGKYIYNKEVTFGYFIASYLEEKKRTIRDNTYISYKQRIDSYMMPTFGNMRLDQITERHVNQWLNKLLEKLSSGVAVDVFKMFRQLLDKAKRKRLIIENPAAEIETPKYQRKKMSVWTKEEFNRFLKAAEDSHYYIVFYLALATGMRQSEILGLKWEAINWENETISVRSSLQQKTGQLVDLTKTESSTRTIAINSNDIAVLKRYRNYQIQLRLKLGSAWPASDLVCTSELGNPCTAKNVLRAFYAYTKKAGNKQITFHELRHTHATTLFSEGLETGIIQERLGHKSIDVTMDIYSHVLPHMQKKAAAIIKSVIES
jgi:integrase